MYIKVSRHMTSHILGGFRSGDERTWFSNIIYIAPPEMPTYRHEDPRQT
jgi:hypothetical protein